MTRGRPRNILAPCRFCGREFKRAEHLRRHERVHTREKPFSCDCGETFSRQDLLTRHQRLTHSQEVPVAENEPEVEVEDQPQASHSAQPNLESNVSGHGPAAGDLHGCSAGSYYMHGSSSVTSNNHLQQEQSIDNQPLTIPDFVPGFDEFDERDFLWDNFLADGQLAPANFFDIDFTLVGMPQQVAAPPLANISQPWIPESAAQPRTYASASCGQQTQPESLNMRLPSLEPEIQPPASTNTSNAISSSTFRRFPTARPPWKISTDEYQDISQAMTEVCRELPQTYSIPSQHTLSRYLEGYFRGFYDHFPFLHIANFSPAALGTELILSLAAAGAVYRFERSKGYDLYRFAKAAIDRRLDQWNDEALARDSASPPEPSPAAHCGQSGLRILQAMVMLVAVALWSGGSLKRDMISLSAEAAVLIRDFGISSPEELPKATWDTWCRAEERRRTLFVAYSVFNVQCIAFNMPPLILNQEVCLNLPSCANVWNASSAAEWAEVRPRATLSFQGVLQQLLSGTPVHQKQLISAFGNYVLILGLFQEVFFARLGAGCLADSQNPSGPEFVERMETALRLWQQSWEATYESTLDPASPKGPLGFNSTALLRLVYIRLNANTGHLRKLVAHDPSCVDSAFTDGKGGALQRSPRLDRAVLQCIYALSVPVRVGIAFVARTQTLNWSSQHALCNLECALFLAHWLRFVASGIEAAGLDSVQPDEQKLLNMVASLVKETELAHIAEGPCRDASTARQLAAATVRLWAQTFKGSQVFEIAQQIGASLYKVADVLDTI